MFSKIYRNRAALLMIFAGLIFTLDAFGQYPNPNKSNSGNNRQRAIAFEKEGHALYDEKKDYKGAVQKYLQATEADKTYAPPFWSMGMALSNLHEHKLAGQAIKVFLDLSPNVPAAYVWFQIGNQYRLAKEFELSSSAFDSAIRTTPNDIRDLESIANIYGYRGNLQKAVEYRTKAIGYNNSDDDTAHYVGLGWYYSFLGQHQKAIDATTRAIQINSQEAMSYTNRCRAYNDLNLPDKAMADCNQALKLFPNHGETQYYLANSYRLKGNLKEAARLNKLSITNLAAEFKKQLDAESITIHDWCYILGNALFEDKQYDNAIKAYEAGLEFRSVFPQMRYNLAIAYLKVGNVEAAQQQYRDLVQLDPIRADKLRQRILENR